MEPQIMVQSGKLSAEEKSISLNLSHKKKKIAGDKFKSTVKFFLYYKKLLNSFKA